MRKAAVLVSSCLVFMQVVQAQEVSREKLIESLARPVIDSTGLFMSFEASHIDLRTIKEDGGAVSCRFRWKNVGSEPVQVVKIVTTCACAAPSYSTEPVAPGDTSGFGIKYYPKGHPGKINRRIMVYTSASGSRPAAVLTLGGYVEPAVLPTWEYPVSFGPLLLKRSEVPMKADGGVVTERVMCLNAGEEELKLGVNKDLVPPGFEVWVEPEKLAPGAKADICIRFRPESGLRAPARVPIVLEGLALPPSDRTLTVLTE